MVRSNGLLPIPRQVPCVCECLMISYMLCCVPACRRILPREPLPSHHACVCPSGGSGKPRVDALCGRKGMGEPQVEGSVVGWRLVGEEEEALR